MSYFYTYLSTTQLSQGRICAEIILWSNPDQVMVEEDQLMVELTERL